MAKPRPELWGESVRELGVLLLHLVPLDILVETIKNTDHPQPTHWGVAVFFAAFGFILIYVGVAVEEVATMYVAISAFSLICAAMIGIGFYEKFRYNREQAAKKETRNHASVA